MIILPKTKVQKTKRYSLSQIQKIQQYYDKYALLLNQATAPFQQFSGFENRKIVKHMSTFSMKLKRNLVGLYIVNVRIQGKNLLFLLDTGAQISGVFEKQVKDFSGTYTEEKVQVGSIGGKSKDSNCIIIPKLFLGAIEIQNQPLVVLDDKDFSLPYVNLKVMKFDGIIGWDILQNFDFELDDVNQRFTILDSKQTFLFQNFIPSTFPTVCLLGNNNQPALFGFDSGAKESWLGKQYIKSAHLDVDGEQKAFGMGALGIETLDLIIVKDLDLYMYNQQISLQKIMSGRVDMFQNVELAGVLGNKIFRNRKIQIFSSKQYLRIV